MQDWMDIAVECVLLQQNVFSCGRMCSLTIDWIKAMQDWMDIAVECVLLQQNVFFYNRMCSLAVECVLLL